MTSNFGSFCQVLWATISGAIESKSSPSQRSHCFIPSYTFQDDLEESYTLRTQGSILATGQHKRVRGLILLQNSLLPPSIAVFFLHYAM